MYIIFGTIIIIIIVLFGNTLVKIFKTYATQSNPGSQVGNLWFVSLLLINIFIIGFIYSYYYYKLGLAGNLGPTGGVGLNGQNGDNNIFIDSNCAYYQNYTSINNK